MEREAQEREEIEYQRRLIENEASGWDVRAEKIKERKVINFVYELIAVISYFHRYRKWR